MIRAAEPDRRGQAAADLLEQVRRVSGQEVSPRLYNAALVACERWGPLQVVVVAVAAAAAAAAAARNDGNDDARIHGTAGANFWRRASRSWT